MTDLLPLREAAALPYLTESEVRGICSYVQPAAQSRYLSSIGVRHTRRPDGSILVWRRDAPGGQDSREAANGFRWSR